jgi:hypothetical protein
LVGVTELLVGDTVVNIGKEREEHEDRKNTDKHQNELKNE